MKYLTSLFIGVWVLGSVFVSLHLIYGISLLETVVYIGFIAAFFVAGLVLWFVVKPIFYKNLEQNKCK